MPHADIVIVGGGLVGLSTALALAERRPSARITVLEKEHSVGAHQSGRNSGVIHSGIYYTPGSLKARLCRDGRQLLTEFCDRHGVRYETCGKVIVAVSDDERERLHAISARGHENGVRNELIGTDRLHELEPHASGVEAIHVPDAGIVDYPGVCDALVAELTARSHQVVTGQRVLSLERVGDTNRVVTATEDGDQVTWECGLVITCGGLQSDRLARMSGLEPDMQVVPFRGIYYELRPEARGLCRNLIYPVPDPRYPFLGVHFTRMTDGRVEMGPNAILATAREGYDLGTWSGADLMEAIRYPGFRALAWQHWPKGVAELGRTLSRRRYLKAVRKLVPATRLEDLVPCRSGIRAQALDKDGRMVDDFVILESEGVVHVCNAPSPAATACLAIGREIANRVS